MIELRVLNKRLKANKWANQAKSWYVCMYVCIPFWFSRGQPPYIWSSPKNPTTASPCQRASLALYWPAGRISSPVAGASLPRRRGDRPRVGSPPWDAPQDWRRWRDLTVGAPVGCGLNWPPWTWYARWACAPGSGGAKAPLSRGEELLVSNDANAPHSPSRF